ncbi:MAG TPA: carboxypeptidase regulatory-like domain-containing protein [Candidatus Limnocylindrales bacterium]|nr:carboxypeptidase regulatory-like domain-containing protein [Candidatus Limnocylindrales bacterium]
MSKRILFVLMICIAAVCFSPLAYGQAIGSFSGTVTDKSGSSIAGASVTVTSQGTGAVRETKTDETGHYILSLLPVGIYTIRIEFQGFQSAESKDLRLQVDESRELNFALNPASVSSTVEVVANAVALETTNPALGQVITSQEVAQLPLNGRDFVQLATLTPGTTAETTSGSFFTNSPTSEVAARGPFSLSVGGSRPNATDWIIDGTDNNELTAGGIGTLSSIDDIQEFKVLTYTYSAEFGTRAGPTVLLTTKSGSNAFHGSLFEFLRNTSLDAKSFFAFGGQREKFNLNQFGGSIGGPIRKNKTFFFLDGEQKFQRRGIPNTGVVPSDAMRNGDFSAVGTITNPNTGGTPFLCDAANNPVPANPDGSQTPVAGGSTCNKIPGNLIDPIGQALMKLYPEPNVTGQGFNFAFSPVRKLDETKIDIRVDHNISSADTLFARFSYDQAVSYAPGGSDPQAPFAEANAFGSNQGFQNHARNISIGETHVFTPTTVNQFTFGYNRIFNYITSQGTGSCAASTIADIGITGANLGCDTSNKCTPGAYSCGLTSLLMTGFYSVGDRGYSPFQGGTNIFSWNDTLDVIRGKHDFKLGVNIRDNQMNVGTEAFQDGFWVPLSFAYSGNIVADTLMGLTSVALHDQTFNGPVTGRRWKIYRPFIQDDWRVTKNLTLNLGIAWDLTTPITEAHDRMANYIPSTNQLLVAGQNGVSKSAGVDRSWTAFEPRIGFAYKLLGSDKTVIRGGIGIFHDSSWSMGAQGLWQNPPYFAESNRFGFGCPFITSACAGGDPSKVTGVSIDSFPIFSGPPTLDTFAGTLFFQPRDFRLGKVQQFNVNAEHQLPGNVVLTVGYAGARGSHILVAGNNLNTFGPSNCAVGVIGCNADGTPFAPSFTPPNGNAVLVFGDYGKTSYDSLQIKAETKSSRYGLYALIGYTYSKTYDNGLSDGLGSLLSAPYFPLPNWGRYDWALSQINLNNSFTASVVYDLPLGRGKRYGSNWNNATNSLLGGWQVTLIEKITSGFPVPLVDSFNESGVFFNSGGNGNNFNRPDQVKGCDVQVSNHGPQKQYINPACFVHAAGHLGDASRVPVYGPGFVNTDFSVIKQFALPWENMGLNFRAEFFNLFNHAQFASPVNDISAPGGGFGQVQNTVNNPRLVQFALKLTF